MAENKESEASSMKDDQPDAGKVAGDGEPTEGKMEQSIDSKATEKEKEGEKEDGGKKEEGEAIEEKTDEEETIQLPSDQAESAANEQSSEGTEPMEVTESQAEEVSEPAEMSMEEQTVLKMEEREEEVMEEKDEEETPTEPAVEEEILMEVENKENISGSVTPSEGSGDGDIAMTMTVGENCYCGKDRSFEDVELQCTQCAKWFHKACISTISVANALPYMTTYTFTCRNCNPSKIETFSRKVANFRELCHCALANLMARNKGADPPKTLFSKESELIPFIDTHWEQLTPMPRRTTITWHGTIVKAMVYL